MKLFIVLVLITYLSFIKAQLKGTAQLTYYESYARCCKKNPNYSPSAPTQECDLYSACDYPGYFAAYNTKKPFDWVKSNNIIAFYDSSDRNGTKWNSRYAKKTIRLSKNGKTFTATIADTCGDHDCKGCCYRNAKGGYLVDLEYYTVLRNLGSLSTASGTINFEIL